MGGPRVRMDLRRQEKDSSYGTMNNPGMAEIIQYGTIDGTWILRSPGNGTAKEMRKRSRKRVDEAKPSPTFTSANAKRIS